jgi:carboxyl-terminal processing protease
MNLSLPLAAALCALLSLEPPAPTPPPAAAPPASAAEPFDAAKAWAEFTELLRTNYGYFSRPGIDGEAILRTFEPRALAATTQADFREVLQLIAHNFADPHFVVGPLDVRDYNVFPTAADLVGRYRAGRFEVLDVRQGSDAEQQGLRPGAEIVRLDGQAPAAAIEAAMGRPLAALSAPQIEAGLNIALAGIRQQPRQLTLRTGATSQTYTLRPPGEQAKALNDAPPLSVTPHGAATVIRFNNSLGRNETIAAFREALQQALGARVLVLDFRNTPSGGNTTVARSIMGHFVRREQPYQIHVVPAEERQFGVPRKFVEYVLPLAPYYPGKVVVLGGHWTGSMGEGLLIGFDALGFQTAGSGLADLLGAMFNEHLDASDAKIDLAEEQLFRVNGQPREDFVPALYLEASEGRAGHDELLERAIRAAR